VACAAHAVLADVGWFERYQAYLIALGAYLALVALADVPAAGRRRAVAAAVVVAVPFGLQKIDLLVDAPTAADDIARHHVQAAHFLDRYYDGQPIVTDQLGYISLLHDGPVTDLAGLGDYEVLSLPDGGVDRWQEIAAERGARVAVIYDTVALGHAPSTWILVGSFHLDGEEVTALTADLQVYATTVDELEPLQRHMAEAAADAPDRSEVVLNENADLQAMALALRDE
jgi:hypothetical protein